MQKLNSIYSKTYNFVYLRAKSILQREEDAQQFVKELYIKAIEEDVREDRLFQWFGKQVYTLGCGRFRKKKAREASYIEVAEQDYQSSKEVDLETTKEVICETLEQLPDMYQATLYAFYYDHMSVKEIVGLVGYNKGVILNRLNYVHKYLAKTLDNYKEETDVSVGFSVEAVAEAMKEWTDQKCLEESIASNIYAQICRELNLEVEELEFDETQGGAYKSIGDSILAEELANYRMKQKLELSSKSIAIGIVGVLVIATIIFVLSMGKGKKDDKPQDNLPANDQQTQTDTDLTVDDQEEPEDQEPAMDTSEYIFPYSDKVKITREELENLSLEQLRLARNEIFARYGTIFGVNDLAEYFNAKSWYTPKISFDYFDENVSMNDIEEANLSLIIKVEEEKSR
jgi:DNA-directed RNA polymerase specialized sigma24 family protein